MSNQRMLINSIVLQEARLSSENENIVTSNDEQYRADVDPEGKTDPETKEVLRYREASRWSASATSVPRPMSSYVPS